MKPLALLLLVSASACSAETPCSSGRCQLDVAGPQGWQTLAQDVWDYYSAATGVRGPASPPSDKIHWVSVGDCPTDPLQFQMSDGCWVGNTSVFSLPSGSFVGDIYVMDWAEDKGYLHHELLHAWLALAEDSDGDTGHTRPEWTTLLPQAIHDVH